jgi:hypothetical protein
VLTQIILDAVQIIGKRAIISQGWGGMKCDHVPENVLFVGPCPHDWYILFLSLLFNFFKIFIFVRLFVSKTFEFFCLDIFDILI